MEPAKVLIVSSSADEREVLKIAVEGKLGSSVEEINTAFEAIEILKSDLSIDCVISDEETNDGSALEILSFLSSISSNKPFFICSGGDLADYKNQKIAGRIQKPLDADQIGDILSELIGNHKRAPLSPYFGIGTGTFLNIQSLPCDVFLRLTSSKHLKILNEGDIFSQEDFEKYTQKKVQQLDIRRSDCDKFLKAMLANFLSIQEVEEIMKSPDSIVSIAQKVTDVCFKEDLIGLCHSQVEVKAEKESLGPAKVLSISKSLQKKTARILHDIGFDSQVHAGVMQNVALAVATLNDCDELQTYVENLKINYNEYLNSHSTILAFVAGGFANMMGWDTQGATLKLAMAAYLHDITLTDNDLAQCQTPKDLLRSKKEFSGDQILSFENHPNAAAELVSKLDNPPPDVEKIIAQHHEKPTGKGFPKGINYRQISPLSAAFIIAHDFVNFLSKGGDIAKFLVERSEYYGEGNFRRIMRELALIATSD